MVRKLIRNGSALFTSRQQTILGAAFILASMVALSRILGLVRTRLLAQYFPPSEIAVYFAAFRIPDFLYNVLVYGALSIAFIPVFSQTLQRKGRDEAFCFASNLLTLGVIFYSLLSVLAIIFAEPLARIVAPGFNPEEFSEMVMLTRALMFSQLFFVAGGMFSSILQVQKRFLMPAIAGVLYNFGIISGIVLLSSTVGIWAPVVGVYAGAFLYCVSQLPALRDSGFYFKRCFSLNDRHLYEVLRLIGPRTFAIIADQIKMTATMSFASLISSRSVTLFTISHQLFLVPIGLFAASMAQAALPVFSEEYSKGDLKSFSKTLTVSLHQMLFFILPSAAILIVLKIPVVRLVFGADQFDWPATVLTSLTVAWLSVGLAFEAANMLFMRAFYALHDTLTPVKVMIGSLLVEMFFAWWLTQSMGFDVSGLGIAVTIGGGLGSFLLFLAIARKIPGLWSKELFMPLIKMIVCAFMMAIALYVPVKALDQIVIDTTKTVNLIILTGIAGGCGMIMYLLFTWVLRVKEAFLIVDYGRQILKKGKDLASKSATNPS